MSDFSMIFAEHAFFIWASYAAAAIIWLGLIVDTWLRVRRGRRHD